MRFESLWGGQDPAKALTQRHSKQEGGDTAMTDVSVKSEGKDADSKRAGAAGASSSAAGVSAAAAASAAAPAKPNALAKAHAVTKPKPKSGLGHLVGYTPNRGDFDTEWENDAELTLADMEFKEEDTKSEAQAQQRCRMPATPGQARIAAASPRLRLLIRPVFAAPCCTCVCVCV